MTIRPQSRSDIRGLLEKHGIRPRKRLGQNFLADPNIAERIVRTAAVGRGDLVVEIGAGTGTLTLGLAATGARIVGYEVDERLRPLLVEALDGLDNVEIRFGDALESDLSVSLDGGPWTMVANLPYNVGTPLLIELVRRAPAIHRFVVMVQKEVADRLVARPGSKAYGLPSVSIALRADARRAFNVGPQVFIPRPDVDSSVVVVERKPVPAPARRAEELAAAAFNQRRKMLRRSLATVLADPTHPLEEAGIEPEARAEDLTSGDYLRLAASVDR